MKWAMLLALPAMGGCLERRIQVTSEPPGATVWINDVEVGRTPLETGFTYYGTYDVRVRREGFEPVWTGRDARTPVWEWPPIDLAATAWPGRIENEVDWHFQLTPSPPDDLDGLVRRARELQGRAAPVP